MIYRIALLEDNKKQLEKLRAYLRMIPNVELVLMSRNSDEFFEKLPTCQPDILLTDLDLGNDSMTGMEVAQEIKLPVFFASINTSDYVEDMENLKRDAEICIDHITKPFTEEQFLKSFKRFLKEVELFSNLQFVYLNFNKTKTKIHLDQIVYICADKQQGSESNNKQVFFSNQKPQNLIDFSFSKMEELGFPKSQFITIHKSFRVNKNHIQKYHSKTGEVELKIFDKDNFTKSTKLPVSENYQKEIKKIFGK